MLKRQHNKLRMYLNTQKVLDDNSALFSSTPAVAAIRNNFSGKIQAILSASGSQQSLTTGIATDKKALKHKLAASATVVVGIVHAYAVVSHDYQLMAEVDFSRNQLFKKRDVVLPQICRLIYDRAHANFAALSGYGLKLLHLSSLQNDIDRFETGSSAPRVALVNKQAITKSIALAFREADKLLKFQIDMMMMRLKTTQPEFYNTYKAAREIKMFGATDTRARIFVNDNKGNPLEGAVASLLQNKVVVYTKTASANGVIAISRVKPGVFDLLIEKPGFKPQLKSDLEFKSGKRVKRSVSLDM
jgi:hypothetical protein